MADGSSASHPRRLTWIATSGRVIRAMNNRLPTSAWNFVLLHFCSSGLLIRLNSSRFVGRDFCCEEFDGIAYK